MRVIAILRQLTLYPKSAFTAFRFTSYPKYLILGQFTVDSKLTGCVLTSIAEGLRLQL